MASAADPGARGSRCRSSSIGNHSLSRRSGDAVRHAKRVPQRQGLACLQLQGKQFPYKYVYYALTHNAIIIIIIIQYTYLP